MGSIAGCEGSLCVPAAAPPPNQAADAADDISPKDGFQVLHKRLDDCKHQQTAADVFERG
jgi:hypothetical protein